MNEPEVALVLSPEQWVEDLHRHCADHGGARVRQLVVDPTLALEEDYGVLVVSHRWPGLTRGLVETLHAGGREILGVFDPLEPAAVAHLAALGVERTIASDAAMSDFVGALREIAPASPPRGDPLVPGVAEAPAARIIAVGGAAGAGATEIAIAFAQGVSRHAHVVLVDGDECSPGLAVRLALPIDPNLRTAVDAVEHGLGELVDATLRVDGMEAIAGLPNPAAWSHVRAGEVVRVVRALARQAATVVVNVGSHLEDVPTPSHGRYAISRALVNVSDAVIAVGAGTPVGVVRLLSWCASARALATDAALHIVVNGVPRDPFRREEVADEILRSVAAASLTFVPRDRRVDIAGWAGATVPRGPFTKALRQLVSAVSRP